MSTYWSFDTSWRIRSIGKSGARSSGPTGFPVPGCSTGGGGVGRSWSTLYQRVGSSLSSSRILCAAVPAMPVTLDSPGVRWRWSVGVVLLVLAGCTSNMDRPRAAASPGVPPSPSEVVAPSDEPSQSPSQGPSQGPSQRPTPSPSAPRSPDRRHLSVERADPRWRFYSTDRTRHTSPWYAGAHRVMIGYGCTVAPYYAHDPRCPGHQGFHHGIDVAMPCGTRLSSDLRGRVVDPVSPGAPGPAYGPYAFRIRSTGPHPVD